MRRSVVCIPTKVLNSLSFANFYVFNNILPLRAIIPPFWAKIRVFPAFPSYLTYMLKQLNILLVDNNLDDHSFFNAALRKIRSFKHSVLSFFDGVEVIDYLTLPLKQVKTKPDIIFLDMHMPHMGGLSTLKKIKQMEEYRDTPVYMFTSSSSLEDFRLCNIAGAFGFFTKGFQISKLTKQLEGIFKEFSTGKNLVY